MTKETFLIDIYPIGQKMYPAGRMYLRTRRTNLASWLRWVRVRNEDEVLRHDAGALIAGIV